MNAELDAVKAEISAHFDNPPDATTSIAYYVQAMQDWICELNRLLNRLYTLEILTLPESDE